MTDSELRLTCTGCGDYSETTDRRYSFGYYAGLLCSECATTYRDHCGIDQSQGNPADLDEVEYEPMTGYEVVYGSHPRMKELGLFDAMAEVRRIAEAVG
jgi:hypothetical protein